MTVALAALEANIADKYSRQERFQFGLIPDLYILRLS